MKKNNVGVFITQNEPSSLSEEEKRLRARKRSLEHELGFQSARADRFRAQVESEDPVKSSSAKVELEIAEKMVRRCVQALADLEKMAVN